jgi:hypothetical protein
MLAFIPEAMECVERRSRDHTLTPLTRRANRDADDLGGGIIVVLYCELPYSAAVRTATSTCFIAAKQAAS